MTEAASRASTVARVRLAFALVVGLAGGFWGLLILFSDYPAGWSATRWLAYVLASHVAFGLAIGALVPRLWFLSLVAGWGALFLGFLSLLGQALGMDADETSGSSEFLLDLLLPVLGSLLAAGFLGAIAVGLFQRARPARRLP
ncbi:MAG TPA: hypothetical protein VEY33_15700 [Gemmatimonadota bacterium]|nr:hypothetical protein [Gemmatimonadota bacterium]